jgi:hypothetical protein
LRHNDSGSLGTTVAAIFDWGLATFWCKPSWTATNRFSLLFPALPSFFHSQNFNEWFSDEKDMIQWLHDGSTSDSTSDGSIHQPSDLYSDLFRFIFKLVRSSLLLPSDLYSDFTFKL